MSDDAPLVTSINPNATYIEDGDAAIIDDAISISDVDSTDFDTGQLSVSVSANASVGDLLFVMARTENGRAGVEDIPWSRR